MADLTPALFASTPSDWRLVRRPTRSAFWPAASHRPRPSPFLVALTLLGLVTVACSPVAPRWSEPAPPASLAPRVARSSADDAPILALPGARGPAIFALPMDVDQVVHVRARTPDGSQRRAVLDTGSATGVGVGPRDPWIAGAWVPANQAGRPGGFFMREHTERSGVLEGLLLGPTALEALPLAISAGYAPHGPVLGIRVLHEFDAAIFDWPRNTLWLVRGQDAHGAATADARWSWVDMWRPRAFGDAPTSLAPLFPTREDLARWLDRNGIPRAAMAEPMWQSADGALMALPETAPFPPGGVRLAGLDALPGRPWIEATIGGVARPMLIDTGARDLWLTDPRVMWRCWKGRAPHDGGGWAGSGRPWARCGPIWTWGRST